MADRDMLRRVVRKFHPVGQGAFYSECHLTSSGPFNIVYDCGNRGCKRQVQPVAAKAFSDSDSIDILFISHFDFDHVSLISALKPYPKSIKKVVLPLLNEDEKAFFSGCYRCAGDQETDLDIDTPLQLLANPHDFFPGAEIVFVRPGENDREIQGELPQNMQEEQVGAQGEVASGVNVGGEAGPWVFIPYNHGFSPRARKLMNALSTWLTKKNYGWADLYKADFVSEHRTVLNGFYQQIGRGSNENSMVVYSGPLTTIPIDCHGFVTSPCKSPSFPMFPVHRAPGCLFTGDAELENFNLAKIFRNYLYLIGTVQIPHHGSNVRFDVAHLPVGGCLCPVSYGLLNKYGHPNAQVLQQIRACGGLPIEVTEDPLSCFTEVFYIC